MPHPLRSQQRPWQIFEITTRCHQGRFLLRPGSEENRRIIGVIGRALSLYGEHVRLYFGGGTSNHLHLTLAARTQRWLGRFKCHVKSNTSRSLSRRSG